MKPLPWKRRVVVTRDIELTLTSPPELHIAYASMFLQLETPRHLMHAGFQDARREWLGVIADALHRGLPIPEKDFDELVEILKKIADAETPAKAFGLSDDKRKQRTIDLDGLNRIAWTVHYYSKQGFPLGTSNKKESAFMMAAKSLGFKTETRLQKEARRAQEGWDLFGHGIMELCNGRAWEQALPPLKKITRKPRKKKITPTQ